MRATLTAVCLVILTQTCWGVEQSDVTFFASFEGTADATIATGQGKTTSVGEVKYGPGKRGRAVILSPKAMLEYAFHGNVVPDEGTIMMWAKPEWSSTDDKFHYFFRASTGNYRGKALNALLLYKYGRWDRLLFYCSNGQETDPSQQRSIAFRDDINLKPDQWVHLAATWSSTLADTQMVLYVNGERVAAAAGAVFVPDQEPKLFDIGDAGGIGGAGWSKDLPFVPYVWIGSNRSGLAWFCEQNQNWHNSDENKAVRIEHTNAGVELHVRFIDALTELKTPLHLTFGFMATPVKPLPAGWRDWRQTFISNPNIDSVIKQGYDRPKCRNIGVVWSTGIGSFSYLPVDPAKLRSAVADLHGHDWQTVLSYFALDYTQTGTPDFVKMEREWRREPYGEATANAELSYASICNASNWADFLVGAINKTMDEAGTDGVYLDCSNPNFCQSAAHGCAPGRFPLFATRELQKRIYALIKAKRGDRGFVYNHVSENNIITTFSFSDAVLNGEQYNRKDLNTLTFDKFRAEFCPYQYGVPCFLLPTLIKFQPHSKEKMPGADFFAFPLLHDVICVPAWLSKDSHELLRKIQDTKRQFGVADAEFLPYWSNHDVLTATPATVTVSAYLRHDAKSLLLIAQGPATPTTATITLSGTLTALRNCPARDALTGTPLHWQNDQLVWSLPGKAVQMAIVAEHE